MQKIMQVLVMVLLVSTNVNSQSFKGFTPPGRSVDVHFYKNVEFLGFVFFLGTMGELYEHDETLTNTGVKKKDWFAYDLYLYQQYKSFKGNKDLVTAARFAESMQGIDLLRLLVQVDEVPHARLQDNMAVESYIGFSEKGDTAEARKNAILFIEALNQFYKDINFALYFKQHDHLYEQALREIKSKLPSGRVIPAMEQFYRQQFDQYTLLPSLTIPSGMAFASNYKINGKTRIFNAFGPFALQHFAAGQPLNMGYADEKHLRELSIHEFGHSFTNPELAKLSPALFKATAVLYDTVRIAMDNQGYDNWKSCVFEHFVRAGEFVIARSLGDDKGAASLQASYIKERQFIYLPIFIRELELYNSNPAMSYLEAANNVMEKLKQAAASIPIQEKH